MPGGVFEGSNDSQFRSADTLYYVKQWPFRLNNTIFPEKEKVLSLCSVQGAEGELLQYSRDGFL